MIAWTFRDPWWLLALAVLAGVLVARRWRRSSVFVVPHAAEWQPVAPRTPLSWTLVAASLGLALLIVALARPQWIEHRAPERKPGYDIVLALDLSTSMYAEDFQSDGRTLSRLQTLKPIIEAFINRRPDDRISIVAFAGKAYTFAPLTLDHDWLRKQTARLTVGAVEDGTAIGDAIGVALNRVEQGARNQEAKRAGSFVVLLTDGGSNRGALDPRQMAELAAERGVVIHTIAAGVDGMVAMPVFDAAGKRVGTEMQQSDLDGLLMRDVAEITGGFYFRAADVKSLVTAFARIDQSERVEFATTPLLIPRDVAAWFLWPALPLLVWAAWGAKLGQREEAIA